MVFLIVLIKAAEDLVPFELLLYILVRAINFEGTEYRLTARAWLGHLHRLLFQLSGVAEVGAGRADRALVLLQLRTSHPVLAYA